jgi:hypothetical protein
LRGAIHVEGFDPGFRFVRERDAFGKLCAGIEAEGLLKSAAIVHQSGFCTIDYARFYIVATSRDARKKTVPEKETAPADCLRRGRLALSG